MFFIVDKVMICLPNYFPKIKMSYCIIVSLSNIFFNTEVTILVHKYTKSVVDFSRILEIG